MTANSTQEVGSSDKVIHFNCKVEYCLLMLNVASVAVEFVEIQGRGKLLLTEISQAAIQEFKMFNSSMEVKLLGSWSYVDRASQMLRFTMLQLRNMNRVNHSH